MMADVNTHYAKLVSDLRARFFPSPVFEELQSTFDDLLQARLVDLEVGRRQEARGMLVIAPSGAGKTRMVQRMFRHHPRGLKLLEHDHAHVDVVSLSVPSPATPKGVGISTLHALGYPLDRDRPAHIVWAFVQSHLKRRQTLFLHLDEAQDFYTSNSERDMRSVINTLKSILQNPDWPVGILLSGMPALLDLVNLDPQLARRFVPVRIPHLSLAADGNIIVAAIKAYSEAAHLGVSADILSNDFLSRLIHSSDGCFGILIELLIGAIGESSVDEASAAGELCVSRFATYFAKRSGCSFGVNPFLSSDYQSLDTRKLLEEEST